MALLGIFLVMPAIFVLLYLISSSCPLLSDIFALLCLVSFLLCLQSLDCPMFGIFLCNLNVLHCYTCNLSFYAYNLGIIPSGIFRPLSEIALE
jgi:hypothetical protein